MKTVDVCAYDGDMTLPDGRYVRWVEQDGGLWQVWIGSAKSWSTTELGSWVGWIWNDGYMPDERVGRPYWALDDWEDHVAPGKAYGSADSLHGALQILIDASQSDSRAAALKLAHTIRTGRSKPI